MSCPHIALCEAPRYKRDRPGVPFESVRIQGAFHSAEEIKEIYGAALAGRLLDFLVNRYLFSAASTTQRRLRAVKSLLLFIADRAIQEGEADTDMFSVWSDFRAARCPDARAFKSVLSIYIAGLRDVSNLTVWSSSSVHTRNRAISILSSSLKDAAEEGICPDIETLQGNRVGRRSPEVPSLGELTDDGTADFKIDYDLSIERSRERLVRLRSLLEDILTEEEAAFDKGQRLLARMHPPLAEIVSAIEPVTHEKRCTAIRRVKKLDAIFPSDDADAALSAILRYLSWRFGNQIPHRGLPPRAKGIVDRFGGVVSIRRFLEGGPRAAMAAWGIVAIDSGMNVQPLDELAADPVVGTAAKGMIKITTIASVKNRAGYKPVPGDLAEGELPKFVCEEDLPLQIAGTRMSSVEAISTWRRLSHVMRQECVGGPAEGLLWIDRSLEVPQEIRPVAPPVWCHAWKYLRGRCAEDPSLRGLYIQRRQLRVTHMHLRDAASPGDSRFVRRVSQHASYRTTSGFYLNRAYMRQRMDKKIRQFQDALEAQLLAPCEYGGQGQEEVTKHAERLAHAQATGLGYRG